MDLVDPLQKLSAGPVHFAYSGWAKVDIDSKSNPSPDESYLLIYRHPYSFEADSWIRAKKQSKKPVCHMNAGYSTGWCESSFNIQLAVAELSCRGRGDDECTFIMAPKNKIKKHIKTFFGFDYDPHLHSLFEPRKFRFK